MDKDGAVLPPRVRTARGSALGQVSRLATPPPDRLLHAALEALPAGLILLDKDAQVRLVTGKAAALIGVPQATGIGMMQLAARSRLLDAAGLQTLAAVFDGNTMRDRQESLLSLPGPDGNLVISLQIGRAGDQGWAVSLQDVTQTRHTQDVLLAQDTTDPVTGLANKWHFLSVLRDRLELAGAGHLAVLRLNVRFSGAGLACLSHDATDMLRRLTAKRILGCLRGDDVAARAVADDFVVMVTNFGSRAALSHLGARLAEALSGVFVIEGEQLTAAALIGIACAPEDGDTAEALLANAALALAAARADRHGTARFFEPRLEDWAQTRRRMAQALRAALAAGEFVLHYQPQIDVRTRRVTVFEALIRWQSSERGLVPPNEFIPLAEETGLICAIGNWVMAQACRDASAWPGRIAVAVNASPLQIEACDFADAVAHALHLSGLPADRLEIEVTENLLLENNEMVNATLLRLRDLGVNLVMDDFGTGYASLSQLARFRFDKIKIDRSLISAPEAATDRSATDRSAIVRAIAALGVSLCVPITAEGVETAAQLGRMTEDGCSLVQGFYFSKPVPAEAVPALLQRLENAADLQDA